MQVNDRMQESKLRWVIIIVFITVILEAKWRDCFQEKKVIIHVMCCWYVNENENWNSASGFSSVKVIVDLGKSYSGTAMVAKAFFFVGSQEKMKGNNWR